MYCSILFFCFDLLCFPLNTETPGLGEESGCSTKNKTEQCKHGGVREKSKKERRQDRRERAKKRERKNKKIKKKYVASVRGSPTV